MLRANQLSHIVFFIFMSFPRQRLRLRSSCFHVIELPLKFRISRRQPTCLDLPSPAANSLKFRISRRCLLIYTCSHFGSSKMAKHSKGGKKMKKTQPASEQLKKCGSAAQRKKKRTHAHATEQQPKRKHRFLNMKPEQVQRRAERQRKRKYRAEQQSNKKQRKKKI